MSCRAPEAEARGLMSYDEEHSSCFFERQPTTPEEEYRAIRAVCASCCGAVRYGGTDPNVIARVESLERGLVASAVTFAADCSEFAPDVLRRIGANMVAAYVGSTASDVTSGNRGDSSWLIFQWPAVPGEQANPAVKLTLSTAWDGDKRWLVSIECSASIQMPAAALQLSDALEGTPGLSTFRWYSDVGSRNWLPLPV
jgi:hypothetical protein